MTCLSTPTSRLTLALAMILLLPLSAQETRGQISGRVADPSGGVIAKAKVRATGTSTNVATSALTGDSGDFLLPFLIPGEYTITAEAPGFKRFVGSGVQVQVNDRVSLDINLEIGESTQTVEVAASAPLLQTATASAGMVIDNRQIAELPMKDGNPIMLSSLAPGVQNLSAGGMGRSRPFDNISVSQVSVSGGFQLTNEFTMDGVPNNTGNKIAFVPPGEMVQEFKIQSAPFDAAAGFSPSAVINVSTKSGTNNLHGSLYYFNQNRALMANSFFNNRAGLAKTASYEHRFGATAGGPVVIPGIYRGRNRTFWQYGYEALRDFNSESPFTETVPTADQLRGDFSALLRVGSQYQIYDPSTIAPAGAGRFSIAPFPGNIIPTNRISPLAKNIGALWGPPNQAGGADGSNNYYDCGCTWNRYYAHMVRLDHNFSAKQRFYIRVALNKNADVYDKRYSDANGAYFYRWNKSFAVDDVYMLSPRLLLNVRYGFTRFVETQEAFGQQFDLVALGFNPGFVNQIKQIDPRRLQLPNINVSGYGALGVDTTYSTRPQTHDLTAVLTHVTGAHQLRYGGGMRVYQQNAFDFGFASGSQSFGTNWTRGPLDSSPSAPIGQGLASFLLGLPTGGSMPINASSAAQSRVFAGFVQDDWKITSRLTLNLGLRYELETALTERYNRTVRGFDAVSASPVEAQALANYALNPIPELPVSQFKVKGGLTFAGVNNQPRTLWNADSNNFMPRFGFAYAINNATVLRGGYGLFFDLNGIARQGVTQTGFSSSTALVPSTDNGQTFVATLANPFPNGFAQPVGTAQGLGTFMGQGIKFYNPNLLNPYNQRWEMSLQRSFAKEFVLEAAYIGNRGSQIRIGRNLNALPGQYYSTSPVRDQNAINFQSAAVTNPFYPLLPGTSLASQTVSRSQLLLPNPQFTSINMDVNQGYTWYHSLQTRLERRFAAGYTFSAAYTWSKLMGAVSFLNAFDALPERVISDQDRTHRLVLSGIWELPFGKGRRYLSAVHPIGDKILGGWQFAGLYQAQSGQPLNWGNIIFTGTLHDVPLSGDKASVEQWININAGFQRASNQQLGANVRTFPSRFSGIRGPIMNNWDLSLLKNVGITEHTRAQFRGEFINAFNHSQFAPSIDTNPVNSTFGRLNSLNHLPRVVQLGLKVTF